MSRAEPECDRNEPMCCKEKVKSRGRRTFNPDGPSYLINTTILTRFIFLIMLTAVAVELQAQRVDSIYFNLYTDSLKKGTHNYINVDGKLSNGKWVPLTSDEVQFSSSACKFSGNELIIPADFGEDAITIKAVLKNNPRLSLEKTIWIKKKPDPELPTMDEVMKSSKDKTKKKKK